jgi:hypothetical protein
VALRKNLFEQRAEFGNVPLTIPQLVDELADGVGCCLAERAVERAVDAFDAQIGVEDDERFADGPDDVFGISPRRGDRELAALQIVDADQHQHRAVHLVVSRQVGPDS